VQALFLAGLGAPEAAGSFDVEAMFEQPPAGSLAERWRIYHEGYRIRIAEAIESDHPATRRILGPGAFRALCRRYLEDCPPRSFDLGRVADRLPDWLRGDAIGRTLPFLPDLARFERALADAVVTPDARPTRREDLAALGPEGVAGLHVAPAPGTALIRSPWPVPDLWALRGRPDDEVDLQVDGRPADVVVWRVGLEVRWRSLNGEEVFLEKLGRGATLATLARRGEQPADPARIDRLVVLFRRMIEESIVRAMLPFQEHSARMPERRP
jgi:hypothetical protein